MKDTIVYWATAAATGATFGIWVKALETGSAPLAVYALATWVLVATLFLYATKLRLDT